MDMIITDIQILAIIICAALSLVAYRCRIPTLALVPGVGFFILGYELFDASGDFLILILFFMTAVAQFIVCFGHDSKR